MLLFRPARVCAGWLLALASLAAGCRSLPQDEGRGGGAPRCQSTEARSPAPQIATRAHQEEVVPAAYRQEAPPRFELLDEGFAVQEELELAQVVEEVLARNPSLQAAIAAWQAAAQRYPQVISLDDPMFGMMLGPGSWGSDEVESAYMLELSQKVPWPGKRQLRGSVAAAQARAAGHDVRDVQLRLAEAAQQAFLDYYLAHRELEVNDENVRLMREFRDAADAKYRANQVPQQDVLQAEVELAELERRQFELQRSAQVAVARINTLMHLPPDRPLPPPPEALAPPMEVAPVELLRQLAAMRRPDLAALNAQAQAESASLSLAHREYYPDLELVARYDAFWQEDPLRTAVGLNLNVPLALNRRRGAVRESAARLSQRRAELAQRLDEIGYEVQAGYERLVESRRVVELYRTTLLPVSEKNVALARAGYIAGQIDFLRLIEAQRQLVGLQEKSYEAEAQYHRRLAELERAVGGPLPEFVPAMEALPAPNPSPPRAMGGPAQW